MAGLTGIPLGWATARLALFCLLAAAVVAGSTSRPRYQPAPTVVGASSAALPWAGIDPYLDELTKHDSANTSATGSGFDDVPCGADPAPVPARRIAQRADHVRSIESFEEPGCYRWVFVLGYHVDNHPVELQWAESDRWSPVGFFPTQDSPRRWAIDGGRYVPGLDVLDTDFGLVAATEAGILVPPTHSRVWDNPARWVFDMETDTPPDTALVTGQAGQTIVYKEPYPALADGPTTIRFLDPGGSATGTISLREAPFGRQPAGSGLLVDAVWARRVFPDMHWGWFHCGWVNPVPIEADELTRGSSYHYATPAEPLLIDEAVTIYGLDAGRYELAFESPDGTSASFFEFSVEPCLATHLTPDGAAVTAPDGQSHVLSLGQSIDEALAVMEPLVGPSLRYGGHCGSAEQHGFANSGLRLEARNGIVTAIGGVTTADGVGPLSPIDDLDLLGFDVEFVYSNVTGGAPVAFVAGPYHGKLLGYFELPSLSQRVYTLWTGEVCL